MTVEPEVKSIASLVGLPNGDSVVTAVNFKQLSDQGIFVINSKGHVLRKIGKYGEGPGEYNRLADIYADSEGRIWTTDFLAPRVSVFDTSGTLLRTLMVPKLQYLRNLWLDEKAQRLYASGCRNTVDGDTLSTCKLLQEIDAKTGGYLNSFVESDPQGPKNGFYRFVRYSMARGGDGVFWLAEQGFLQVYRFGEKDPAVKRIVLRSSLARPPAPFPAKISSTQVQLVFDTVSQIDRIVINGDSIVVSVNCPDRKMYLLEVLDRQGRQIGEDLRAPGRLVGQGNDGSLYFSADSPQGVTVMRAKLMGVK